MAPARRPRRAHAVLRALALLLALAAAGAQESAPRPPPDLAPRALGPEELDAVTVARLALRYELDGVALDALGASGAPGLVLGVALAGQTVFLEAYGSASVRGAPLAVGAPLWLGSASEPLTAIAVLRLAAQGRLDLDADAATLLPPGAVGPPAHPDPGPVTVRELLTRTAGFGVPWSGRPAALAAIVESATGSAPEAAYAELVFEPLGFARATTAADAGAAYEAATVPGHAVGPGGVTELEAPRPLDDGGGLLRASALDVMALAEALTAPEAPAALGGDVRGQLFAPAVRLGDGMPGRTLGFGETAILGHPAVRQDGDLPGARSALLVVPDAQLAVFAHVNGAGGDAGLEAASGRRDARDVLLEAVVARLLGDARDADDAGRGWPAAVGAASDRDASTNAPRSGPYRFEGVARSGPERLLAAAAPGVRVTNRGDAVDVVPPPDVAAPATYRRWDDGVLRRVGDGAPLAVDGSGRLLLHLGTTLGLERVPPLERPGVVAASHLAAAVAALLVLVSWPIGALARWRRREPVAWTLPAAVGRARGLARVGAVAVVAVLAILAALALPARATSDAALAAAVPALQAAAAVLAVAVVGLVVVVASGAARAPGQHVRWLVHAVVAVAFAALLVQGWTWGLWSPDALQATWTGLVGGGAVAAGPNP